MAYFERKYEFKKNSERSHLQFFLHFEHFVNSVKNPFSASSVGYATGRHFVGNGEESSGSGAKSQ